MFPNTRLTFSAEINQGGSTTESDSPDPNEGPTTMLPTFYRIPPPTSSPVSQHTPIPATPTNTTTRDEVNSPLSSLFEDIKFTYLDAQSDGYRFLAETDLLVQKATRYKARIISLEGEVHALRGTIDLLSRRLTQARPAGSLARLDDPVQPSSAQRKRHRVGSPGPLRRSLK